MVPCRRLPDSAHRSTFANITPRGSGVVDMNNIRRPNIFPRIPRHLFPLEAQPCAFSLQTHRLLKRYGDGGAPAIANRSGVRKQLRNPMGKGCTRRERVSCQRVSMH